MMIIMSNYHTDILFEDMSHEMQEAFLSQAYAEAESYSYKKREHTRKEFVYDVSSITFKELAKRGLTNEQIADCCGLSREDFDLFLSTDDVLEKSLTVGRAQGIAEITGALYRSAITGNRKAMETYLQYKAGWKPDIEEDTPLNIEINVIETD